MSPTSYQTAPPRNFILAQRRRLVNGDPYQKILIRFPASPAEGLRMDIMDAPMQSGWFPLWLSLRVAAVATLAAVPCALALGWLLSRCEFRGKQVVQGAILLPLMFPPTVLGFYLLVLFSQGTLLAKAWESAFGSPLLFTWRAAALAALIHTAPLLVRACRDALEALPRDVERAARSCGASGWTVFWRVALPQIQRALAAAAVLAFGRALGDFGITLMIAGNIPGSTQTLPVAVYSAASSGNGAYARALVLAVSALILGLMYAAARLEPKRALR